LISYLKKNAKAENGEGKKADLGILSTKNRKRQVAEAEKQVKQKNENQLGLLNFFFPLLR